ncbi:uncharacterized protein FOMMEDRAFT_152081 [Fomitiporia mediterranea MF3/22]|uniref:uncharacterized protein n=1 Tax=Fomitiporia mediterranea (strain MF3/22) TaxID=694068 RepID=UPI000440924C|nr:uncharacterized protein FOMMEDRAFT_152081 [Fomitiporia mediterranea MF3/22]EJD06771.1 hypothetical protein FOMMEDRAFT_152081 [Fomitiporia mediterranea MF3/22]
MPTSSGWEKGEEGREEAASARHRVREIISDKRVIEGGVTVVCKKTQSKNEELGNVGRRVFMPTNECVGTARLPPNMPTYLTVAAAPPPTEPPRLLCTVYWDDISAKEGPWHIAIGTVEKPMMTHYRLLERRLY